MKRYRPNPVSNGYLCNLRFDNGSKMQVVVKADSREEALAIMSKALSTYDDVKVEMNHILIFK